MPAPVIRLKSVSWRYARAEAPALSGISAEIMEGEFVAVMGADGAGKSTLCRLLNGLIPHSMPGSLAGSVEIDGEPTSSSTVARLAEKVGMAFDDPDSQLFTSRAFDEVAFGLENMEMPPGQIAERARWALGAAGLSRLAERDPATLSGGQKQRLAIAAALAMAGRALALDEPCSRLDPAGAREVLSLVRDLRAGKRLAVVMATASADDAAEFADRALVLKGGRALAFAAPGEIFRDERLLAEAGIGAPETCELAFRMRALGRPLPRIPMGEADAARAVLDWRASLDWGGGRAAPRGRKKPAKGKMRRGRPPSARRGFGTATSRAASPRWPAPA